jgi:hypothetical protein
MSTTSTPKPKRNDLKTVATFLYSPVMNAVTASIMTSAADGFFGKDPEHKLFTQNPANTLPYLALNALEDRSIVEISEVLHDDHDMIPEGVSLRRARDLRNHRDVLSHTNKIEFGRAGLQEFFEAKKQWTDLRAAIVWDMWCSLDEHLSRLGQRLGPPLDGLSIGLYPIHATMLHSICRYSMTAESLKEITEEKLLDYLQTYRDAFVNYIVKRPDGDRG